MLKSNFRNFISFAFVFTFFLLFSSFSFAQTLTKNQVITALRAADLEQTLEIEFGSDLSKIGASGGGEAALGVHQIFNLQIGGESGSVFFDAVGFSPDFERNEEGNIVFDENGVPVPRTNGYLVRSVGKITEADGKVILTFQYPFPLKGKANTFALIFFIDGDGLLKADAFNKAKNQFAILTTGQAIK